MAGNGLRALIRPNEIFFPKPLIKVGGKHEPVNSLSQTLPAYRQLTRGGIRRQLKRQRAQMEVNVRIPPSPKTWRRKPKISIAEQVKEPYAALYVIYCHLEVRTCAAPGPFQWECGARILFWT